MIVWKVDVLEKLNKKGYTTYYILKNKLIGSQTLNNLKHGKMVNMQTLDFLCTVLECQPSKLIEWKPDDK